MACPWPFYMTGVVTSLLNCLNVWVGVLGIENLQTSAYHPECNGQEERPHRMMNAALTAFVDAQGLDWDIVIKTVLYAIRNSYHTAIDNTPFNVFMGRQAREPTDIIFGNVSVLLDLACDFILRNNIECFCCTSIKTPTC
jgi:hypothetical protein